MDIAIASLFSIIIIFMNEFDKLKKNIDILRSPDGCPWDKKQTHLSLLPYLFEEANEVCDEIINENYNLLKEELGDLLLQVMLHSKIAEERNKFNIFDVIKKLNKKLIHRHPHVFKDKKVNDSDDVVKLWEEIKSEEKKGIKKESILDNAPKNGSPLIRSYKLQKEASKVGFDWDNYNDVLLKIDEEINELKEAINNNDKKEIEDELGDVLFSLINLARFFNIHSDIALTKSNLRFIKRFNYIEKKIKKLNKKFSDFSLSELDNFWNEAKKNIK
jgi:tetrapyrrole methylase family protein/MazG family protein